MLVQSEEWASVTQYQSTLCLQTIFSERENFLADLFLQLTIQFCCGRQLYEERKKAGIGELEVCMEDYVT